MEKELVTALEKLSKPRPLSVRGEGFYITGKKGFHIVFPNGYTISVQFGPGNYCANYDRYIGREEEVSGEQGSSTAETAYWGPDGKMIEEGGDSVQAYQTVAQVMERIIRINALPTPSVP